MFIENWILTWRGRKPSIAKASSCTKRRTTITCTLPYGNWRTLHALRDIMKKQERSLNVVSRRSRKVQIIGLMLFAWFRSVVWRLNGVILNGRLYYWQQ